MPPGSNKQELNLHNYYNTCLIPRRTYYFVYHGVTLYDISLNLQEKHKIINSNSKKILEKQFDFQPKKFPHLNRMQPKFQLEFFDILSSCDLNFKFNSKRMFIDSALLSTVLRGSAKLAVKHALYHENDPIIFINQNASQIYYVVVFFP